MPSISTLNRWARLKSPWVLVLPVRLWRVHFTGMLLLQASPPIEGLVHCDPDRGSGASLLILAADPHRRARGPEIGPSGFRPPPRPPPPPPPPPGSRGPGDGPPGFPPPPREPTWPALPSGRCGR